MHQRSPLADSPPEPRPSGSGIRIERSWRLAVPTIKSTSASTRALNAAVKVGTARLITQERDGYFGSLLEIGFGHAMNSDSEIVIAWRALQASLDVRVRAVKVQFSPIEI